MTHLVFYAIILLLVAFLIGCFVGSLFGRRKGDVGAASATRTTPEPPAAKAEREQVEPSAIAAAVGTTPVQSAEPEPAPPEVAAPKQAESAEPLAVHTDATRSEADAVGARPAQLTEARGGIPDDLKKIRGIGKVNEDRLHKLGVFHFDQIAAWGPQEIAWVDAVLSFKGRIEREDWVGQAARLANGD